MAGVNDIVQQARLMAAVQAYEAGDKDLAYRALGISMPNGIDPSQRALNETRTALGQQQYGYNELANPEKLFGLQQRNDYNTEKNPLDLQSKLLANDKNAEGLVRDTVMNYSTVLPDELPTDKKELDALKTANELNGGALANTALSLLRTSGYQLTADNAQRMTNALMAAKGIDMGYTGLPAQAEVGAVLANHAASTGKGGFVPGDMANYYKMADEGINALSTPSEDNPLAGALSILGTNSLKANGMGDALHGTFSFLGDRNGPLDNTVMDGLHNFARQNGGATYERDMAMFYSKLPQILAQVAKDNKFSDVKQLVEHMQNQKDADAAWTDVMKQAYTAYRPLYAPSSK